MIDQQTRGIAAHSRERMMGERELSGEAGKQVPARGQDHVERADRHHVDDVLADEKRQCGDRNCADHGDSRHLAPVDERTEISP